MFTKHPRSMVQAGLLCLALIAAGTAGCRSSDRPLSTLLPVPNTAERLQALIDQSAADGLPGVSLAVKGTTMDFAGVAGANDLATAAPLTTDDRFYLASVGKTYTATILVMMANSGLIDLDDPITAWLPAAISELIPFSNDITIRSLLNHTSGIFDYQDDADEWLFGAFLPDPDRHWTNMDVLPYFLGRPSHFVPLTDVRYSDSNYVLAGLIAEIAGGMPMQELVRNYVTAPLGLQRTVHGFEAAGLPGLAHGYVELEGATLDVYPWYSHYGVSDGGIQASASDLADFVRAALTGESLLNDAMREELLTPPDVGNPPSNVALGFDIGTGPTAEVTAYTSRGKDAGSRADVAHFAWGDESVTIALCASASLGDYDTRYEQLYQAVLDELIDAGILPGG